MGLYNMVFGYNPATVLIAPMLADRHPVDFFPRFRDCYIEDGNIVIYTRVGGGNRTYDENPPHECMYDEDDWHMGFDFGESKLYEMPTFMRTWDDDFDPTYGYYEFSVPDEWKDDFDKIMAGDIASVSDAYINRVAECFGLSDDEADGLRVVDVDADRMGDAPDWDMLFRKLKGEFDG